MTQLKKYFENLLEPQVLAILLIVLAACIVLTMIFGQKVNGFKENKSKFYTYVFSLAFIYSIIAFLGFNKLFMDKELHEFIFYQVSSLVLGIIHCRLYRSYLQKFNDDKKLTEYFFALIAALYSLIPFGLIYTLLNGSQFLPLMLGHYLLFFVPTLFNDTFNRAMSIPPRIYKTWQFPQNYKQLAGVSDEEMRDLVVFSFMIDKGEFSEKYDINFTLVDEMHYFNIGRKPTKELIMDAQFVFSDITDITLEEAKSGKYKIVKVMFLGNPEEMKKFQTEYEDTIKERYEGVLSQSYVYEVLPKGYNKGTGLKNLAEKLGIKQEEVMAIGDGNNDVEMLEYGMPPACGWGNSERNFWLLEGVSGREAVPFPIIKRKTDN